MDNETKKMLEEINEVHEQKMAEVNDIDVEETMDDVSETEIDDTIEKPESDSSETEDSTLKTEDSTLKTEDSEDKEKGSVPKELIVKAINAGVNYEDIKDIKDVEIIEAIISKELKTEETSKTSNQGEGEIDLKVLDLDPELYDEDTVELFSNVKNILQNQNKIISTLMKERQEEIPSVISGKLSELGSDEQKMVKDKMDILSAGYKSSGVEISSEKLFDEALKLVNKGTISRVQKQKLKERSKQFSNRVPGKTGNRVNKKLSGKELEASVVDKIDKQLNVYRKG